MDRRHFIKICGASAALAGLQARAGRLHAAGLNRYARVKLTDGAGQAVKASRLASDEAYVFHYPYKGTPCFLIHLGQPSAKDVSLSTAEQERYVWPGGVGRNGEVVAFSAICAHRLAYPDKAASAITYSSGHSNVAGRSGAIVCCVHRSVYDPAQGAKVLSGPAPQPLASVRLEYEPESDELYAAGIYGGDLFERFFLSYKRRLNAEHGPGVAQQEVTGTAEIRRLSEYARSLIRC
ncbi:MAG: Rieske 2Fe-2S domain-containing protein [Pseudomonadota bacterium]|jgi:Rieske Fe-S protein